MGIGGESGEGSGRLVGRDAEITGVAEMIDRSGRRAPRIVVTGEPGVGKSALLGAARQMLEDDLGHTVVSARGRPGTGGIAAGAFLDVLGSAPPPGDTASVLWWLRNTLSEAADVVVLDDAHLADEVSLAVCDQLAESGATAVLVATRSLDSVPTSFGEVTGRRSGGLIDLRRLDHSDTAELVRSMEREEVCEGAVETIHELTAGLPLAVCGLVRSAREAGSPVCVPGWRWQASLSENPNLVSLLRSRLDGASGDVARLACLVAAMDAPLPYGAAELVVPSRAVSDAVRLGLLVEHEVCLTWSYALLGHAAAAWFPEGERRSVRAELADRLASSALDSLEILQLAAQLDLERANADADLQVAAARALLDNGMAEEAEAHARAASTARPTDHEAALVGALAGTVLQRADARARARHALRSAPAPQHLIEAARACAHRQYSTHGNLAAAHEVIDDAEALAADDSTRDRIDFVRLQIGAGAMAPHTFIDAATRFLSGDQAPEHERVAAEGYLSVRLAICGDPAGAEALARRARAELGRDGCGTGQDSGYFGGALAALFSGDAIEAQRLVVEGSKMLESTARSGADVGHRYMRFGIDAFRGHAHARTVRYVAECDDAGILEYSVSARIQSVWELALARDPRAEQLWNEVQTAPESLRRGAGFLEAFAEVALLASGGETDAAATRALKLAQLFDEAPSAAAWLLHDAARHGRPEEAVGPLEVMAASQDGRWIPALFADNARAADARCPELLITSAEAMRRGGFDLFAAEQEARAVGELNRRGEPEAAHRCAARARRDLDRAGGAWSPLLDALEPHPLTGRQREICRLAAEGIPNKVLARQLGISQRTVENHLHRAYAVLGVDREGLKDVVL